MPRTPKKVVHNYFGCVMVFLLSYLSVILSSLSLSTGRRIAQVHDPTPEEVLRGEREERLEQEKLDV